MQNLDAGGFKVGYAATAMPIRYAVERGRWTEAATIVPPSPAPPHVLAIAVWARGLGLARSGSAEKAAGTVQQFGALQDATRGRGKPYRATQGRHTEARSRSLVCAGAGKAAGCGGRDT